MARIKNKRKMKIGWSIAGAVLGVILILATVFGIRWAVHSQTPDKGYGEYLFSEIKRRLNPDNENFDKTEFLKTFPYIVIDENADSVKIMQIADPQIKFGGFTRDTKTMDLLDRAIKAEKPDLCVVTGDLTLSVFTYDAFKYFADFMEARKQPWAFVYGNHDSQFDCSKYTIWQLLSKYEYCLFQRGPSDIHGESNYLVNVFKGSFGTENLAYSCVLLDSGMYPEDGNVNLTDWVYDWIRTDQTDWYTWAVNGLKRVKADIQSSMFFHIPIKEFADMYYLNEQAKGNPIPEAVKNALPDVEISEVKGVVRESDKKESEFVYGDDGYTVGIFYQGNAKGADHPDVFAKIKELGSTKALFCGHDHVNTLKGWYDGVYLGYGLCCGYHTYPFFDSEFFLTNWLGLSDKILYNGDLWLDENGNRMEKGVTVIQISLANSTYGSITVTDNPDSFYK